jgi:hypothetical protein
LSGGAAGLIFCSESFLFGVEPFLIAGRSLEKELSSCFYTLKLLFTRSKVRAYYYLLDLLLLLFGIFYNFTYYISSSVPWSTSLKIDLGFSLLFFDNLPYFNCRLVIYVYFLGIYLVRMGGGGAFFYTAFIYWMF